MSRLNYDNKIVPWLFKCGGCKIYHPLESMCIECKRRRMEKEKENDMYKYIQKRLNKIHKLAVEVEAICSGVGSLTKIKDAVVEIKKISKEILEG